MYRGLTLLILLLMIVAALYAPISIPYNLVSVASVLPAEEWRLLQEPGGGLACTHQNNRSGVVERIAAWQFERGDLTGMELNIPDSTGLVTLGDTLVRMYSAAIQQQILDLENQLKIKRSEQQVLVTGEKQPIIQEAQTKLVFAKEALVLREKDFAAAKQLLQEGLMPRLEYNRIENVLELAKIDIITAEKALLVADTGAKPESISLNQSEIQAIVRQLDFLRKRNAGYVIKAPFTGMVMPIKEPGEVLILRKISEYIVTIPVKTEEMIFISDTARLQIIDPITWKVYEAKVMEKMSHTEVLDSRSVGFVRAIVKPTTAAERMTLGVASKCSIQCGMLNPRQYLQRILKYKIN